VGFLSFTAWQFALAGAICASGPIIIHLLNRRRFKVIEWAAMDFLREAMQRNRRIMQIRDILLLLLRTAAVLLFGLALAQPFFATREEEFNDRQPLHAVIVVDNSLSMAYEALDGNLLAKAKDRARQLIDKLPAGSKMSIIPACGGRDWTLDPYGTKENALEALDKIEIVDRSASLVRAVNEAKRASEAAPELAKRIVFISDQQQLNWRDLRNADLLKDLPAMQVVDVAPAEWENTWIADLRVQDGLADVETPTTVIVEIEHRGSTARRDVQVTLSMGETVLGEKTVTIEPGLGGKEVDFEVVFNALPQLPEPDKPVFVPLRASLAPDRLAADDERHLAVPVVASLPVVFVDQYGADGEDLIQSKVGETRPLRKLLAPKTSRTDAPRQLVKVRHIALADLTQDVLSDARLVVLAGIQDPGDSVPLLRQYVQQGGRLVIAAGAAFDPSAWNDAAWLDGAGILPLPLAREPIGEVPEAAGDSLQVFHLSFESLAGEDYFQVANVGEPELRDLFAEPFFFKAVEVEASAETLDRLRAADEKRLEEELTAMAAAQARRSELAAKQGRGELSPAERQLLESDDAKLREIRPQWLTWAGSSERIADTAEQSLPDSSAERARILQTLALQRQPKVLATFEGDKHSPYLVSRPVGRGEVIFAASGLASSWNTLATTNAIVAFDRILRSQLQRTLAERNFAARERLTLPLASDEPNLTVSLARPGHKEPDEPLDVGYLGGSSASGAERGVTVTNLLTRGVYRVAALRTVASADPQLAADRPVWEVPLVVSGDASESDLSPLARDDFDQLAANANLRWIGPAEDISLAGVAIHGQTSWWWLALAVFLILLAEMALLAWPSVRPQEVIAA
jgi:Aerotolerance regulator N-terminal/von Willebrand factor type A domain